jgi:TonB-linked SusC/RagA family outer membrane protein
MSYLRITYVLLLFFVCGAMVKGQEATSEQKTVTGVVYDATTLYPIEIAAVSCGSFSSTFTDMEGVFSIDVTGRADVLKVTAMGYHTKEVVIGNRSQVDIYLVDISTPSKQQTANIGYFNLRKIFTTQSVGSLDHIDDKQKSNVGVSDDSFDGRIAGVNVIKANGIKGFGSDIFIRGFNTMNAANRPLVVLDGMVYDVNNYGSSLFAGYRTNAFAGLDINDIESVSVIRDAASIYGGNAANGVIFIRTNHAIKQATTIDFFMNQAVEMAPRTLPLMGAEEYRTYLYEMLVSQGLSPQAVNDLPFISSDVNTPGYYSYRNQTDWQKMIYRNSVSNNYGLSIKGGDDVALYALNVSYLKQGGTIEESNFSRFNLRFNSDINISKRIVLNSNIGFNYLEKNLPASGIGGTIDPLHQARIKAPFLQERIQNQFGVVTPDLADSDWFNVSNPVALLQNMQQLDASYRFAGSFDFNVKASQFLTISNLVGISFAKTRESMFIPSWGVPDDTLVNGVITNRLKKLVFRNLAVNNDLRATYQRVFNSKHGLNAVAGARLNVTNIEEDWGADYNTANDQMRNLGGGNFRLREKGGLLGEWSGLTYYINGNYDFMKKYFLSASVSLDGSSRVGEKAGDVTLFDTQFGFFPGVSGAWLVSSEPFMEGLSLVEVLKLRASYGLTGNDGIGNYTAKRYYSANNLLIYKGYVLGNIHNPYLGWEKNTKTNFGIDVVFAKEKVSLSVDVYSNKTTDMFDFVEADVVAGKAGYFANSGGFTTKGIDVELNGRILNKPLVWDMGVVLSKYTTNVDDLWDRSRVQTIHGANILTQIGNPLGVFYGYKTNGVYASSAQAANDGLQARMTNGSLMPFAAGDIMFVEKTVDGIIDEKDMQVIGDPTPDFFGELFTKLRYKRFTIDASLGFSVGHDVFNHARYSLEKMDNLDNQLQSVANRWQYDGQVTNMPRAVANDPIGNSRFSDRWIEDGSYARLKNVTISYVIPAKLGFLKRAEVFATGLNLLTFTRYKGLDPEFSAGNSPLLQGIDLGMVPQNQAFLAGIKVGL